jgi:hypothetical protein
MNKIESFEQDCFLLIINDEYVSMNRINKLNESEYFNRENLIAYFLNQKLNSQNLNITNVFSLNKLISSQEKTLCIQCKLQS